MLEKKYDLVLQSKGKSLFQKTFGQLFDQEDVNLLRDIFIWNKTQVDRVPVR